MELWPRSRRGRVALWLLLPVLLYPFYWSVFLLVPDSWRAVSIAVVVVLAVLALVSLTVAGLAIARDRERSVLLIVVTSLTAVLVLTFVVGELVGGH